MSAHQDVPETTERAMLEILRQYVDTRRKIAILEADKEMTAKLLRRYLLEENPDDDLVDNERGFRARLQERQTISYDTASMDDALITWARDQHILDVNHKMAREHRGKSGEGDRLAQYIIPGVTYALVVEEKKEGE